MGSLNTVVLARRHICLTSCTSFSFAFSLLELKNRQHPRKQNLSACIFFILKWQQNESYSEDQISLYIWIYNSLKGSLYHVRREEIAIFKELNLTENLFFFFFKFFIYLFFFTENLLILFFNFKFKPNQWT